jgi:hypothetical protein
MESTHALGGKVGLPKTLAAELIKLRRKVWTTKILEATAAALGGIGVAYLFVFAMDRFGDTPMIVRGLAAAAALTCCALIPYCLHRSVWSQRKFQQLARMISHRYPRIGHQLLGIIELSENELEQTRSRSLVRAAIEQVSQDPEVASLSLAAPPSYHRAMSLFAAGTLGIVVGLFVLWPAAAQNALNRFLAPWQHIARYTFTRVAPLDDELVVPHGEDFEVSLALTPQSAWTPDAAYLRLGNQRPLEAALQSGEYHFLMRGQLQESALQAAVGDWAQNVKLVPKFRPELKSVLVDVTLPDYLQIPTHLELDARAGRVAPVRGSKAVILASADRELTSATLNGNATSVAGGTFQSAPMSVEERVTHTISWKDSDGLTGAKPFELAIEPKEDAAPVVHVAGLSPAQIVLDSEQLAFEVAALDDFGIREVGIEWKGVTQNSGIKPALGERLVAVGGPDKAKMNLTTTFTATSLGIEPQIIELRVFATDYRPERRRAYSATFLLEVLDQHDHATWVTGEIAKLYKKALEVRDREMRLHEMNREIRALSDEDIASESVQRRIAAQAAAELSNGRNLRSVVGQGRTMLQQAARNPELDPNGVATLAEMLAALDDMSQHRMPSIANLMKESVAERKPGSPSNPTANMMAGISRSGAVQGRKKIPVKQGALPPGMKLADSETSHQPDEPPPNEPPQKIKASAAALRLAQTSLKGRPTKGPAPNAREGFDQAYEDQTKLLDDFARLASEMGEALAKMEGATFIKRLKAASREQSRMAAELMSDAESSFGLATARDAEAAVDSSAVLAAPAAGIPQRVLDNSNKLAVIMDDMYAYVDRVAAEPMRDVLEQMRTDDVLGSLRMLATDVSDEPATSVGQLEYWADATDRWAEDLLTSAGGCKCPGGGWKASLPPEIVLEVLHILEAQIAVREETRAAQKTKLAVPKEQYVAEANRLAQAQAKLMDRTDECVEKIELLPNAASFGKEIDLLETAVEVMEEAAAILGKPSTGGQATAAESEAIEVLLAAKRAGEMKMGANENPGGGSSGTTSNPALALIGQGLDAKAVRVSTETDQSIGKSGRALPEELRAGLNRFFNLMERQEN